MNDIRKIRTKNCYIDSTCDIIRNEGMNAATIRNISDKVGYNSATLYSYFDNLPHLLLCAHMRFEEELLHRFQSEIEDNNISDYYAIWSHMYMLMAEYYMDNPNIFDCAFVSKYAGEAGKDMRTHREQESAFGKYVKESLTRIAKETSRDIKIIEQINTICLSQTVGMVLLSVKERTGNHSGEQLKAFEQQIKLIIKCFIEEPKEIMEEAVNERNS